MVVTYNKYVYAIAMYRNKTLTITVALTVFTRKNYRNRNRIIAATAFTILTVQSNTKSPITQQI